MNDLMTIARQIPLGYACQSCGSSAYNWMMKIARYQATGETCCPDFRYWRDQAKKANEAAAQ